MKFGLLFNRRTRQSYRLDGCRLSKRKPLAITQFSSQINRNQLPSGVDLRPMLSPIEQQRAIGSCVGNALAAIYEYFYLRTHNHLKDFSRLFIYYNARRLEDELSSPDTFRHATESDSGADIQYGIAGLIQYGCCDEQLWPYETILVNKKPSDQAYQHAKRYLVQEYSKLSNDIIDLKECLAGGYPFVMAIKIFSSFAADHHGFVPMPKANEKMSIYRHAVVCVGYIDEQKVFIIRNSHGKQWGADGYGFLPYEYVTDKELTKELWTVKSITNMIRLDVHQARAAWIHSPFRSISRAASQQRMAAEPIDDKQDWDIVYTTQNGPEMNNNDDDFNYDPARTPRRHSADLFGQLNSRGERQQSPHHYHNLLHNHNVRQSSPSPTRDNRHHSHGSDINLHHLHRHPSRDEHHQRRHSRESPFLAEQQRSFLLPSMYGPSFGFQPGPNFGAMGNMVPPFQMGAPAFPNPMMNFPFANNPFVGNQPFNDGFNNPFMPPFYPPF
ncbi:unnamed protein product [Didymodactylos carnosus]|uniref:Peptidase C1A papain C-terminal domain-containing protein n=1 Tax=Didymodactylos carnosus TaxID=1234261 RepID=A0A815YV73_9BILA|nr:unnamed protein product [Didymodactylos carnosus]CAF1574589.1 unnamed protein product [Didymodactylos carnosus]CAF3910714.1 unnamed protein product [Didymodactylos carnosus]CAF4439193.1 unnamed protein product [Didymodactylos carnosus]